MRRPSLTTTMTVFLLFFGIALLEALQLRHWWSALFWVVIAALFFTLGLRDRRARPR